MGELIGVLVWIGIMVLGVIRKNATNDNKKKNVEDIEKKIKDIFSGKIDWNTLQTKPAQSEVSEKEKEFVKEKWIPAYEGTSEKGSVPVKEVETMIQNITVERNVYNPDTANARKTAAKSKKEKMPDSESKDKKILLDEDDLIKGIIFKEILDRPRAINPYKNIARR